MAAPTGLFRFPPRRAWDWSPVRNVPGTPQLPWHQQMFRRGEGGAGVGGEGERQGNAQHPPCQPLCRQDLGMKAQPIPQKEDGQQQLGLLAQR